MSIDRLRYFAAVVETRNLRQAAELVGISPPSMSKAISVLEAELGHKLIHPDGRGIGITPKGFDIYKSSIRLIEEERQFYKQIKSDIKTTRIRIATFEVFSSYFMSGFLRRENSEVTLLEMTPGKIEQTLLAGTIEHGITYLPAPNQALEYREVGSFEVCIFGLKCWENRPFKEWPFAIPTTELKIHSSEIDSLDMWPQRAPARTVRYQFELLETALQTSRAGLSVLHCPNFIVPLHNEHMRTEYQLVKLPDPSGYKKPRPTKVYLVGRKGGVSERLERKLAKFMRSLAD